MSAPTHPTKPERKEFPSPLTPAREDREQQAPPRRNPERDDRDADE